MLTRNHNTISLIRGGNVLCASFSVLISWMAAAHSGYHFSSRNIVLGSIDLVWLFGALCLFFRLRAAWMTCLVGTGASACFWGYSLVACIAEWFGEQKGLDIFMLGAVSMVALIWMIPFSASCGLFIGLIRKRRDLL